MKNYKSNKRMRKLPVLLGALLMISIMAYGTRAYFTDSAKTDSNIQLELGNVAVGITDSGWKKENSESNKSKPGENEEITKFNKVKPGDKFKNTVTIKNNGSLKQKVDITFKEVNKNDYYLFTITDKKTHETVTGPEKLEFKSKGKKQYSIELTVKESGSAEKFNEESSKNNNQDTTDLENIKDFITVEAEQLNSNKNAN